MDFPSFEVNVPAFVADRKKKKIPFHYIFSHSASKFSTFVDNVALVFTSSFIIAVQIELLYNSSIPTMQLFFVR